MEYRLFLPENTSLSPWFANKSSVETRADDYILVSDEFGLKVRGGKKLELKYRLHKNINGVEKWIKVMHVKLNVDAKTLGYGIELQQLVIEKLKCKITSEGVKECITAVENATMPFTVVRISKQRTIEELLEQTDIRVDRISPFPKYLGKYRSFCYEGKSMESKIIQINEKLQQIDSSNSPIYLFPQSKPMGYPEFLRVLSEADPVVEENLFSCLTQFLYA